MGIVVFLRAVWTYTVHYHGYGLNPHMVIIQCVANRGKMDACLPVHNNYSSIHHKGVSPELLSYRSTAINYYSIISLSHASMLKKNERTKSLIDYSTYLRYDIRNSETNSSVYRSRPWNQPCFV